MDKIKVLIVDDHEMVRLGMRSYLLTEKNIELVGEASSGLEAAKLAKQYEPDVILMDLLMEDGTGIDATKNILAFLPSCKVIILTSYYDDEQVFPALEAGAHSYLLKTAKAEEVAQAIYKSMKGEVVIEPKVATKMMNRFRKKEKKPHEDLTERELDVLKCLGRRIIKSRNQRCAFYWYQDSQDACEQHFEQTGCNRSDAGCHLCQ